MTEAVVIPAQGHRRLVVGNEPGHIRRVDARLVAQQQNETVGAVVDGTKARADGGAAPRPVRRVLNDLSVAQIHRRAHLLAGRAEGHKKLVEPAGPSDRERRVQKRAPLKGEELLRLPETARGTRCKNQARDEQQLVPHACMRRRGQGCLVVGDVPVAAASAAEPVVAVGIADVGSALIDHDSHLADRVDDLHRCRDRLW